MRWLDNHYGSRLAGSHMFYIQTLYNIVLLDIQSELLLLYISTNLPDVALQIQGYWHLAQHLVRLAML